MENSNALDIPLSDRYRAAWRCSAGIGGAPAQLSLVRQLHGASQQCDGVPFHKSRSVRSDGVGDSRTLLPKSALSLGTPAPIPHELRRRRRRSGSLRIRLRTLGGFRPASAESFLPCSLARREPACCSDAGSGLVRSRGGRIGNPSLRLRPLGRSRVLQIFLVVRRTYLPYMLPALEARMQLDIARRAPSVDHAVALRFIAGGILRPMLGQGCVGVVFAPLASLDREVCVAVSDGFSSVGFAAQLGVELGNRVRSSESNTAFGR
jgi:hypothetical protein